eukprot:32693_1
MSAPLLWVFPLLLYCKHPCIPPSSYAYSNVTIANSKQIESFKPWDISDLLTISNPITAFLFSIIAIFVLVILCGFCHNQCPIQFNKIFCNKCKVSDNFRPKRVFSFLLNVLTWLNSWNTVYGFYYHFIHYQYDIGFFIFFLSLLAIVIIQTILHFIYLIFHFPNDLDLIAADYLTKTWFHKNKFCLIILTTFSDSLYSGISFANSYLFGIDTFSMNLTDLQMSKFKSVKWCNYNVNLLCCSFIKFVIYIIAILYIYINNFENSETIKSFTIISIVFGVYTLCWNLTSLLMKNPIYNIKKFKLTIKCDHDKKDQKRIQKVQGLTKKILDEVSKTLAINQQQIEIINCVECNNGIILTFMYNECSKNGENYQNDVTLRHMSYSSFENDIQMKLMHLQSDDKFKEELRETYCLNNVPSSIEIESLRNRVLRETSYIQL